MTWATIGNIVALMLFLLSIGIIADVYHIGIGRARPVLWFYLFLCAAVLWAGASSSSG